MTARVVNLQPDVHKVVDALLPWYVNGTLDKDELAGVSQHLRECASCRAEVHWLRDLHAACASASAESIPGASHAFGALRRKFAQRLSHAALPDGGPRSGFRGTAWGAAAAAMALVVVVALAASLQRPLDIAPYHTLGAPGAAGNATGSLVVVFDPSTTEEDMRRVLREAHARVVDGPTMANAYVLDVAAGRREDALHTLRGQRAVVLAERLGSQDEP